jgi:uncharacterized repeat protein (TIGR01451 family)
MKLALVLVSAVVLARPAMASTLNVPSQYADINSAINAATNGDTVLVADGTYTGSGNGGMVTAKAITLQSVNGAASTIVDLGSKYFLQVTGNMTISGFTFINSTSGVGVLKFYADATLQDSVFRNNNSGFNFVGAVSTQGGTQTITRCVFDHNTGLGALNANSTVTVVDSTFTNNTGAFGSGAIYANTATIHVTGSTFAGNQSYSNDNGGVGYLLNGTFTFSHCTFTNNSSQVYGGVFFCSAQGLDTLCAFDHSLLQGNSALRGGIGSAAGSSGVTTVRVVDSVIANNSATNDGAVIDVPSGGIAPVLQFTNVTFYNNAVTAVGSTQSGLFSASLATTLNLTNVILYSDNTPNAFSALAPLTAINVTTSDIAQGAYGTINADPQLTDPTNGDFTIGGHSPCAFTGTSVGAPADDYAGNAWVGGVSMGAYAATPLVASTVVVSAPSVATAGAAFFATVTVRDQYGQVFTGYAGTMHFTSTDAAAVLPADTTLTNGIGTITATLKTAGGQTLTATDTVSPSLTGTSANINVNPGAVSTLAVTAPAIVQAGAPFTITVTAMDVYGNVDTNYSGPVHASASDGAAVLPPDSSLSAGAATLAITLGTLGDQTITIVDSGAASPTGQAVINVVAAPLSDLTITKQHSGDFTIGQSGNYVITVANNGAAATAGAVTVTDQVPAGLVLTAMAGSGWVCDVGTATCTRSDALAVGASFSPITVTVSVTTNAAATITNIATVAGGGEGDATNDTAQDATIITGGTPDLTLALRHVLPFRVGQTDATYVITVSNSGRGSTFGDVTVVTAIPVGLSPHTLTGSGWTCDLAALTCSRSDVLAAASSYPDISLVMDVAGGETPVISTATVSGGGELTTDNDSATDTMDLIDAPAHGCSAVTADLSLVLAALLVATRLRRSAKSKG